MTLRRGFRAEAERIANGLRTDLGLQAADPLPLEDAARARGVRVVSAASLVALERLNELERIQAFAFSACTLDLAGGPVIVFNPLRSEPRRRSDIAHELSHLLLGHELTEIREVGGVPFRTCRADQEEEATTLGGTLLLPRALLIQVTARGMELDEIARTYGITRDMVRFRINTTGVLRQVERARARRAPP
jgi:Zn-dependent peptidase ImmA (M78 family)